jgi:serine/threonine-protein kinase RsbW
MQTHPFAITFTATETGVRDAMRAIMRRVQSDAAEPEAQVAIEIAIAEAVNNIVEHGYAGMKPGEICVRIHPSPARVRIEIIDSGAPYPGGLVPEPSTHDLSRSIHDLPEGGFGWLLIRRLASGVAYRRKKGRNHLFLAIERPATGGAD